LGKSRQRDQSEACYDFMHSSMLTDSGWSTSPGDELLDKGHRNLEIFPRLKSVFGFV
jgi:hypothetical protein